MDFYERNAVPRLAAELRQLREERGISQRQLAHHAGVRSSIVSRAESGEDSRLSTWEKLFDGLGYRIEWSFQELAEEVGALLEEETERRQERQRQGLCAGKRRYY